jgi:serine protease Do/serine protease DegQ
VILALDGNPVRDAADFRNKLALLRQGTNVRLSASRQDLVFTASVTLEPPAYQDLEGRDLNGLLDGVVFQFERPVLLTDVADVVVDSVTAASLAYEGGLRAGDVVLSVNDRLVDGPDGLAALLKGKEKRLLLGVSRGARRVFVLIG